MIVVNGSTRIGLYNEFSNTLIPLNVKIEVAQTLHGPLR
jgi:hypothetical protein